MTYTHHVPGRLRVRSAKVKRDAARAAELERWLRSIPGVTGVQLSVVTGSALIHYDVRIADGIGLVMLLRDEGWIGAAVPQRPRPERPAASEAIRNLLPPKTVQRLLAHAIFKAVAEAAIERSVLAIAAAIL